VLHLCSLSRVSRLAFVHQHVLGSERIQSLNTWLFQGHGQLGNMVMPDGVFRIYLTLAITWPQVAHSEEDHFMAAAQVHGVVS